MASESTIATPPSATELSSPVTSSEVPSQSASVSGTAAFLPLIASELEQVEELFRARLASDVSFIDDAGTYIAAGGGKRVRPALLLLVARAIDRLGEEAVTYAAVVELIHTATLVHDDVVDHSGLRRGQATPNQKWGNSRTVLLGDWIYTTAMHLALRHDRVDVIRTLVEATLKMTEGELLTLERLGAPDLTLDEYYRIIRRKTAHLFAAACQVPTLIDPDSARQSSELGDSLRSYGMELGLCFQLKDDLLDFTAVSDDLGKPSLADLREGKLTLPVLLSLPKISDQERQRIFQVMKDRSFDRIPAEQVLDIIAREGTVEQATQIAEQHGQNALEALSKIPASSARNALEAAPDFVLHRRS